MGLRRSSFAVLLGSLILACGGQSEQGASGSGGANKVSQGAGGTSSSTTGDPSSSGTANSIGTSSSGGTLALAAEPVAALGFVAGTMEASRLVVATRFKLVPSASKRLHGPDTCEEQGTFHSMVGCCGFRPPRVCVTMWCGTVDAGATSEAGASGGTGVAGDAGADRGHRRQSLAAELVWRSPRGLC